MKVGHIIKGERIRQKVKQTVLAKGICTPSYLSRIEQGLIIPSDEVIYLLVRKLGIEINKINRRNLQTEIEFEKYLKEVYKDTIHNRDMNFTKQKLIDLENQSSLFEDPSLYYTYLLILLRFRLIIGEELKESKESLDTLDELKLNFTPSQAYLFKLNSALYYHLINNNKKSIEYFEDVLSIVPSITLEEWEKAELNYMMGLAYIADNRILLSIDYIKTALEYFKDNFLMKRVLDCYLLIGITYKKSKRYEEAFDSYLKAIKICNQFDLQGQLGIIYQNIGSLNIAMGNSKEGISYFYKSLEHKDDGKSQLISIFSLVIEYSKESNEELVLDWCNHGISLLNQLKDRSLDSYFYHFGFYKSLYGDTDLFHKSAVQVIDYFKKLNDYRHAQKYCIALAQRFFSEKKYKLASTFFIEANEYSYIAKNIQKWEEL